MDTELVAIVSHWDVTRLREIASEELLAAANNEVDLGAMFERWRAFGPMVSYLGCEGHGQIVDSDETGRMITATYVAKAVFENGKAQIQLVLVKRGGKWYVFSFDAEPQITTKHDT